MKHKRLIIGAITLVVVLTVLGGIGWNVLRTPRPNVIFLLLDTLRADHVGINGYERDTSPVIDAFARENLNFSFAVTAAPWTPSSVASMFTGLYASAHGFMPPKDIKQAKKLTRLNSKTTTIAEVFKDNGYQTGAVVSNIWITKQLGFDQGFLRYEQFLRIPAGKVNEEAFKMLDQLTEGSAPFFLYLHYMDPHARYNPPAEYRDLFKGPVAAWDYSEKDVRNIGLYDGAIRYLDTSIGRLFDYLKNKGLYDNTIIVLVSDHGEQFGERGHRGHGFDVHNEEIRSFLALKGPGLKGQIDDVVSTVDILPTILDLAGLRSPRGVQGVSLVSKLAYRRQNGVLSEIKRKYNRKAYIDPAGRKLILKFKDEDDWLLGPEQKPSEATVYDFRKDYSEVHPLADEQLQTSLQAEFMALYRRVRGGAEEGEVEQVEIDASTLKELKSLGYLSGNK